MSNSEEIIRLLVEHREGDRSALERLLPFVYGELRAIAANFLSAEGEDGTLQPTTLVHEAYTRLLGQSAVDIRDRAQFIALAAQIMRTLLVEHSRAGRATLGLDDTAAPARSFGDQVDLIALDVALRRLAELDETQSRIVELHYFGGLSFEQIAETLDLPPESVAREWTMARAWLKRQLSA